MKAIILAGAVILLATTAMAAEPRSPTEPLGGFPPRVADAGQQDQGAVRTVEEKREWLRLRLIAALDDPDQIRDTEARLARMSPEQLDELVRVYRQRMAEGELMQEQRRLAEATALRDDLRWLYQQRTGAVGFQPAVTWLPSGAHLSAGATISPHGQVNVNAFPFFSEVHDIGTFGFAPHIPLRHPSGFFRGHPHGHHAHGHHAHGHHAHGHHPHGHRHRHGHRHHDHRWQGPDQDSRDRAFPPTWYDGLRTRVGPRPPGR